MISRGRLRPRSPRRSAPKPPATSPSLATTNPDAYDAYLRGIWHLKGRSSATPNVADWSEERVAAIEELERAVAQDGNFALARAALASAYTQRFFYESTDPVLEQKAFLEIQRALAINPNQAEAYLARAQLTWNLRNRFPHERAITDLRRALSINPNLAEAYIELGKVYLHIGLTDKAVDANEQAQRLDPGAAAPTNRRVNALIDAGRLEEVRHELDRNGTRLLRLYRADALLAIGQPVDAVQVLSPLRSPKSGDPESDTGTTWPCWQSCTPDSAVARRLSAPWPQLSLRRRTRPGFPICITRSFTLGARLPFSAVRTRPCAGSRRPSTRVTRRIRGSQRIKASRV